MLTRPIPQGSLLLPWDLGEGYYKKTPGLIWLFDYYPLLVVQVGSDTVKKS